MTGYDLGSIDSAATYLSDAFLELWDTIEQMERRYGDAHSTVRELISICRQVEELKNRLIDLRPEGYVEAMSLEYGWAKGKDNDTGTD